MEAWAIILMLEKERRSNVFAPEANVTQVGSNKMYGLQLGLNGKPPALSSARRDP